MKKLLLIPFALLIFACGGESDGEESEEELGYEETEYDKQIKDFLADKDWKPERKESGLYVYVEEPGSDEKPSLESFLTLNYEGRLLDGTVFDGTSGTPAVFPFPVSNLIKGWQEGMPYFGKGGKGKLVIPPDLGYGSRDQGTIPANSVLVFDVEIIDFANTPPMPPIDMSVDYSGEIEEYCASKNLTDPTITEHGVYLFIENEGGEEKPKQTDFVTIHYKGYLLDGTVFDETTTEPATFQLMGLIMGWREGIPYIGEGGKITMVIPPYMGYGERGSGSIPPNAVLVFEIEMVEFSDSPS